MKSTCWTRERHMLCVLDHVHWIPGDILHNFYVRHLSVGHLEPELEICKELEQSTIQKKPVGHVIDMWDPVHWIPCEILPHFYVRHLSVGNLEPELEICKNLKQSTLPKWKNVSDTWNTCVTCLGPCPLNSWWNSTPLLCKTLDCRSSRTRVGYLQKFRTIYFTKMKKRVGHVKDTCHVSETMPIEFLVKFYPIFM